MLPFQGLLEDSGVLPKPHATGSENLMCRRDMVLNMCLVRRMCDMFWGNLSECLGASPYPIKNDECESRHSFIGQKPPSPGALRGTDRSTETN